MHYFYDKKSNLLCYIYIISVFFQINVFLTQFFNEILEIY